MLTYGVPYDILLAEGGKFMARDYKKELEWENKKYKRLVAKVDKELAEEFLKKLQKPYTSWLREEIENFLKKN